MKRPNEKRWRTTVELGKTVTTMLRLLQHEGKIREVFKFYGKVNEPFVLRLAIVELFKRLLPDHYLAQTVLQEIGGNVASMRPNDPPPPRPDASPGRTV